MLKIQILFYVYVFIICFNRIPNNMLYMVPNLFSYVLQTYDLMQSFTTKYIIKIQSNLKNLKI